MTDYLRRVTVTPALTRIGDTPQSEWRVLLEVFGGSIPLTPTEAKDLQQRLFSIALEISEREEPAPRPTESPRVKELERELEREKQKRSELVRKVAPKEKLAAAIGALEIALEECPPSSDYERNSEDKSTREHALSRDDTRAAYEAAKAWLSEFKA